MQLEHTATYGVRRYTNGSWLAAHVDRCNVDIHSISVIFCRLGTHVISVIMNLGQEVLIIRRLVSIFKFKLLMYPEMVN